MHPRRITEALLLTVLAAGPVRAAEVPHLLADINNTTPRGQLSTAQAAGFVVAGDRLLFSTSSDPNDDEGVLWLTDGTASGTRVLSSSLCPNPCPAIAPLGTWHGLALLKGKTGLWRSDGTSAGTFPLSAPLGDTFDQPLEIVSSSSSNVFYFRSCQQPAGCLLWRSDGTRAGTFPLTGPDGGPSATDPHALAFWGGKLYFLAGTIECGLWSTDGTIKGTSQLLSVAELDEFSGTIVPTPSRLFFTAGDTSEDLWVTDGTPEGSRLIADFPPVPCTPGSGGCNEGDVSATLFALGDAVFFFAYRPDFGAEIWRSDGTPAGTGPRVEMPAAVYIAGQQHVGSHWLLSVGSRSSLDLTLWTASDDFSHAEPLSGCDGGACPSLVQLFASTGDGLLLFAGTDATHGTELWITDGTGGGTHRLSDACPGACSAFEGSNVDTVVLGSVSGLTYFRALPSAAASPYLDDDELWVTDGTPGGTHRVVAGHVSALGVLGGLACFGFAGEGGTDSELWATDGTAAGTRRLTTLQRKAPGSDPLLLKHGGGALLLAWNGSSEGVWRSDGTPEGTYPVPGAELGATRELASSMATQVGPLQFFGVYSSTGPNSSDAELWRTDGTGPGTRGVASFASDAFLDFLAPWSGKLLFLVETQADCTFWSSDGTSEGTHKILPAVPGRRCPTAVAALDRSRFIFVARVEGPGGAVPQIFLSDGTPAGTRQISALRGSREALDPDSPIVIGGIAFLRLPGLNYGDIEIWRTDGTPAGTFRTFKNLVEASELFGYRGFLYFTARTKTDDSRRLYRVAARGGGQPVALAQAAPAEAPQYFADLQFTPANGRLFFDGWDADAGFDLWVTDGTPAGTRRVRRPGSGSCSPDGLVAAGNRVFFSGDDGEHGRELWESDGTPGGTRMVSDLNPGGFSSNPTSLVVSGNYLFFSADDGTSGVEPWALALEP